MEQIPSINEVQINPAVPSSNKYYLAFVIDGVVVSTVLTDAKQSAIFTSSPTIVQIETDSPITEGWTYDGSNFSNPYAE